MTSLTSNEIQCRICHEVDSYANLMTPCDCCGTIAYVHYNCIAQWITTKSTNRCVVCKAIYKDVAIVVKKRSLWTYICYRRAEISAAMSILLFLLYIAFMGFIHSEIAHKSGHKPLARIAFYPSFFIFVVSFVIFLSIIWTVRTEFVEYQLQGLRYVAHTRSTGNTSVKNHTNTNHTVITCDVQ